MTIYVLRGAPASGKSTWIKQNHFEPYTISSDVIRMLYPFNTNSEGEAVISQIWDTKVWSLLYKLVEERLKFGQPVIIDATHSKISSVKEYKKLADKYNYNLKIVDFTTVPLEELLERNKQRNNYQIVPEEVIKRAYEIIKENSADFYTKYEMLFPVPASSQINNEVHDYTSFNSLSDQDYKDLLGNLKDLSKFAEEQQLEIFNQACELFPILSIEKDFDQQNKYHNKTLDKHTLAVIANMPFLVNRGPLYIAALFHDIGKPYTKVVDSVDKTQYHYFGHNVFGSELVKSKIAPLFKKIFTDREIWFMIYLVKHHDDVITEDFIDKLKKKGLTEDEIKQLLYLEIADAKAHIIDNKITARIEMAEKKLKELEK